MRFVIILLYLQELCIKWRILGVVDVDKKEARVEGFAAVKKGIIFR